MSISEGRANNDKSRFGDIPTVQKKMAQLERLTSRRKQNWLKLSPQNGFLRLYAPNGSKSMLYPISSETTVQDICSILAFEDIYFQIGGLHIRRLSSGAKPLQIQNDILMKIGYETVEECRRIGDAVHISHIFCFYMGRPEYARRANTWNEILIAKCLVRKVRLLQKWINRRCILYNGTIRIEHESDDDEILLLSRYRADVAECSKGKYLRLSESAYVYCFLFSEIGEMNLWFARIVQNQMSPTCDLSDRGILFLPDQLFCAAMDRPIISLNIRRNSLLVRPNHHARTPPIGWLDDIQRLTALRSLNIADNALHLFPTAVTQIPTLTELNLSGNRIIVLPNDFGNLINLTTLNLSNNWLGQLPEGLRKCISLSNFDLSFNRFKKIPGVIFSFKKLTHIQIAGNEISSEALHSTVSVHAKRLDVRRNALISSVRLTSLNFINLTEIDLRDNAEIKKLDLSNLSTIQAVHCERLHLTSLQINGSNLRYLYADNNELSHVVIMPIPVNLILFSAAHNRLTKLPDWLADIPVLETISAHHNVITHLPHRILMNQSKLKLLIVNDNEIETLPKCEENCSVEVLKLHNNRIKHLPCNLFKSAIKLLSLNVSCNRLATLPTPRPMNETNRLQYLRAACNKLDETVIRTVIAFRRLRVLDLSYNTLRFFDDSFLNQLYALEEVNLSSNQIVTVSTAFAALPKLQILRLHSNSIVNIPNFSHSPSLVELDISNNKLNNIDPDFCMAKKLKHLDLTENFSLKLDVNAIRPRRKERVVSVVDVSSGSAFSTFQFGFSEAPGQKNKLCIRQIRLKFTDQMIFGIIDGGSNEQVSTLVAEKLTDYFEREMCSGSMDLKRALIKAHEMLGQTGERLGVSALIMTIVNDKLACASSGHVQAILCRNGTTFELNCNCTTITADVYRQIRNGNSTITEDNIIEGVCHCYRSLGFTFLYPSVVPNPDKNDLRIGPHDEFIVIGSRALWHHIEPEKVLSMVHDYRNPQLAAKKLQDTVQSLEYAGNISIIVVRLKKVEDRFYSSLDHQFSPNSKCNMEKSVSEISLSTDEEMLKNIEQRLEQISEAINKIEDDSGHGGIVDQVESIQENRGALGKQSVRYAKHRNAQSTRQRESSQTESLQLPTSALDCKKPKEMCSSGSTSRTPSGASAPPDPHASECTSESNGDQLSMRDKFHREECGFGTLTSRERFQRTRSLIDEQFRALKPTLAMKPLRKHEL